MSIWDDHGYGFGMSCGIHSRWCVCEKCCQCDGCRKRRDGDGKNPSYESLHKRRGQPDKEKQP
jgi:hypothetical protein